MSYDGSGRSTSSSGSYLYRYNGLGQLTGLQTWRNYNHEIAYDEVGRYLEYCTDLTNSGTCDPGSLQEYVWLGDTPVGAILTRNVTDSDGNVISSVREPLYVHSDHLKTPRSLTRAADSTNAAAWRAPAEPFGTALDETSEGYIDPNGTGVQYFYELRFPGQLLSGWYVYNTFRDYDPVAGRYLESDPMGLQGGINTYAYVLGDPLSNFDASGLDVIVTYYPTAAHALGHIGYSLPGEPHSTGFYPRDEGTLHGPGQVKVDQLPFPISKTLPSTPAQDACLKKCRDERAKDPGTYDFFTRQCTAFVRDCLTQCGVYSSDYKGPRPRLFFEDLPIKRVPPQPQ